MTVRAFAGTGGFCAAIFYWPVPVIEMGMGETKLDVFAMICTFAERSPVAVGEKATDKGPETSNDSLTENEIRYPNFLDEYWLRRIPRLRRRIVDLSGRVIESWRWMRVGEGRRG